MLATLRELQADSSIVGDVRGIGLMVAVEFVQPGTKEPNGEVVARVLARALAGGLLLYPCGPYKQTIRLIPPLTITRQQLEQGLAIFCDAVRAESTG